MSLNPFETNTNEKPRRRSAEGQEIGAETKEKAVEEAEKKAAARERVETMAREVTNAKKQMQNITANMQMVMKAVKAIRAQLQLNDDGDVPSVAADNRSLEQLKKKLSSLVAEMKDLRGALIEEEYRDLITTGWRGTEEEKHIEAERRANLKLQKLGL